MLLILKNRVDSAVRIHYNLIGENSTKIKNCYFDKKQQLFNILIKNYAEIC